MKRIINYQQKHLLFLLLMCGINLVSCQTSVSPSDFKDNVIESGATQIVNSTNTISIKVTDELPEADSSVQIGDFKEICSKLDLSNLLLPNDDFTNAKNIMPRIELSVNNAPLTKITSFITNDLIVESTSINARYIGPIRICWETNEIVLGPQSVRLSFLQTNNNKALYEWTFSVVPD